MRCFCVLAGVPDPWCEKWETLYVTRVELTDTATVLSIVACGMEGDGVRWEATEKKGCTCWDVKATVNTGIAVLPAWRSGNIMCSGRPVIYR